MEKVVFESKILPDGHLYCPDELARERGAHFKVIVTFEKTDLLEASEREVELAAANDTCEDYLSEEEVNYYLSLKEI